MRKEIIDKYGEESFKVCKEHDLVALSDNKYQWHGINVLECPNNPSYSQEKFQHMINLQDILKCSEDLKFFTGQLFMYRDYINNPLKEVTSLFGDDLISTYFQNFYDRRYSMYVTCCFEKAYNFWDRIGDRLASFYPELLKIREVDFYRIIDKIDNTKTVNSDNFKWLLEFRYTEYQELNRYRRDMVHYYQFEAKYRFEHAMNNSDFDKLKELWSEKSQFPEFFKKHLELAIKGHCKMIGFLKELIK